MNGKNVKEEQLTLPGFNSELQLRLIEKEKEAVDTMYQLLNIWYTDCVEGRLKKQSCRCYRLSIRHYKEHAADTPLYKVNQKTCQFVLNKMAMEKYSKSTINKVKIVITQAMNYALAMQWIDYMTIGKLKIPKYAPTKVIDALTVAEQKKVEELCDKIDNSLSDATRFILDTGLRPSELMELQWDDVFFNSGQNYIKVRKSKTDSGVRIVPLTSDAAFRIERQAKTCPYVFTQRNGTQLSGTVLSKHNKKIRMELKLDNFNNNVCRHTFATRCVEKGIDAKALSKIMGHSSVAFTMQRYVTASTDYIFEQMRLIDNL